MPGKLTIKDYKDDTPGTGDRTTTALLTGVMLASAMGCGGALWLAAKRKKEEQ